MYSSSSHAHISTPRWLISTPQWLSCLHTMVTLMSPHYGDSPSSTLWWLSCLHTMVTHSSTPWWLSCLHTMVTHSSTLWWLSCLHTMVTLTAPHHGDPHISTSWWPHVSIPKAPHHGDSHLHIVVTACLHIMVSLIFPHHGDSHISTPSPWWLHGYTLGWPSCLHTWDGHMQLTGCQNPTAN